MNAPGNIIIHAKNSILIHKHIPWQWKGNATFDVTMGSYDGAETCELVGSFLLSQLQLNIIRGMASPYFSTYYRSPKNLVRIQSNISFLRDCKRKHLIPQGLRASNILRHTTNSPLAEALAMKHSRQWLQLALDTQYYLLERNKRYVFPLNMLDHQQ